MAKKLVREILPGLPLDGLERGKYTVELNSHGHVERIQSCPTV